MLGSAFTTFLRSFTRHPLYGLLNLLGLSIGIAVFIVLSLLYHFETSYESWSLERPYIYAVGNRLRVPGIPDDVKMQTMGSLLDEIQSSYPQIDGTRDWSTNIVVHHGADLSDEHMELVDPNFLTFFQMPMLRGNAANTLDEPSHIAISARTARKYFGTIDVIGSTMALGEKGGTRTYTVSAVMADLPKNTDLRFDMLRRLTPQDEGVFGDGWHTWGFTIVQTYLKFKTPADAAAFSAQIPAFTDRQAGTRFGSGVIPHKAIELSLIPLAGLHLNTPKLKAEIVSLGLVGVLALGLALINYVNLATARAGMRAREVAVRKTLGAPPVVLRMQFLIEAVLTLLLAFLVALSAVELSLPLVNAAGGLSLVLDYRADASWILGLLGCVLVAGLLAALYPAFVLSAFKPALVLASSQTPGGGRFNGGLRTGLAILQFTAVVVAFILMGGFMLQIRHIQTADLGFRRDHMMIVTSCFEPSVTPEQRRAFVAAAAEIPAVRYSSYASNIPGPGSGPGGFSKLTRPGQNELLPVLNVNVSIVGPNYFQMMGARLLAGRLFDAQRAEDQKGASQDNGGADMVFNVILSRSTAKDLGFSSPQAAIGRTARLGEAPVRIIGVVEEMRLSTPNDPIPPALYLLATEENYEFPMVRYQGVSEPVMRQALAKVWRQIAPGVIFDAISANDNLDTYYKPERDRSHLFTIGTGMTALIGCMGLYGMAAFSASRRVREIGMRKVLGASREQMVRLLLWQFLRPVALASVLAWPLAWFALQRWLEQFDDVIAMPLWVFPVASAVAVLIALITVGGLVMASAGTEPGKALRHD